MDLRLPVILATVLLLAGCQSAPAPEEDPADPSGPAYGVTISPRDYDTHFAAFFDEASEVGDVLGWGGTIDHIRDPDGGPAVVAQLANDRVFLQTSPFRQEDGTSPGNLETDGAGWRQDLVDFVEQHDVHFLGVGVEVNLLRYNDADAYDALVEWYPSVYDAVKAASPDTRVFPTFQFERLEGHHGGLWGGVEDAPTEWETLADFPKRDLTAFTTFPFLIEPDVGALPSNYYHSIKEHVDGPVAFTELAWPARDIAEGWPSSDETQAAYIEWFFTHAPAAELTIWVALYDLDFGPPFDHIGLRNDDGTARPAWHTWRDHIE